MQVVTLDRRCFTQYPQRAAVGIDLDLLYSNRTVQLVFVEFLQSELTDMGRTGIIDFIHLAEIALVDTADIPQCVHGVLALGIVARQARVDLDALELVQVYRQPRDLLIVQIKPQWNALERSPPFG